VRLGPTGGDRSTALRPKMAGVARTKRAGAPWKVEDFPHIRRHSRFGCTTKSNRSVPYIRWHSPIGCTTRHPIGQFPEATDAQAQPPGRGGRAAQVMSFYATLIVEFRIFNKPRAAQAMSFYATLVLRLCRLMCGEARPHRQRPFHVNRAPPEDGGRSPNEARAGASWKVEDFPHIRRHSRFGSTVRHPIGQFPTSGGTATSAVQRNPIGQFPPSGGTAASAVQRNPIGQFPEGTDAQARPLGRAAEPRRS
jgi:hypothetical protein